MTLVGVIDKETALRMKLNPIVRLILAWQRRKITRAMALKSAFYSLVFVKENAKQLSEISTLVESGKIRPIIDTVFPLVEVKDALLTVKRGRTKGKVVIKIKE